MEYDIELKISGKIEVKKIEDLKQSVWEYFDKQFGDCVFANDDSELKFVTVKEHKIGKIIDLKQLSLRLREQAKNRAKVKR